MKNTVSYPLSQPSGQPGQEQPVRLTLAQAIFPENRAPHRLTFGEMRCRLMRDFKDFALATHPVPSARRALELTDLDNLWPAYPSGWDQPFGVFLRDIAALLDDPMAIIGRYKAALLRSPSQEAM